jgi:hypothetical protein
MTTDYHNVPWSLNDSPISELLGKTFTSVRGEVGGAQIEIVCTDGSIYVLYHSQDCCEGVSVESITGDVADLIGSPILKAEEATSDKDPEGYKTEDTYRDSLHLDVLQARHGQRLGGHPLAGRVERLLQRERGPRSRGGSVNLCWRDGCGQND